jgi:hypothetical protein
MTKELNDGQLRADHSTTAHRRSIFIESPCNPFKVQVLAQGQTQGSAPREHQQALATGPFDNTCEADAVSPEASMRGLQDKDVYN